MTTLKPLLLAPLALAATILPSLAASSPSVSGKPAIPEKDCLAPAAFETVLSTAGDWIVMRAPDGADKTKLKGIVFRDAGMINVALFEDGCLAAVMVVGKAPPDLQA